MFTESLSYNAIQYNNIIIIERGMESSKPSYREFERILLKTPYEKSTEHIFRKLTWIKNGTAKDMKEEDRTNYVKAATNKKSIAEALLVCKTGGIVELKGKGLSTQIAKSTSTYIENKLEELYKEEWLNHEPMTLEEGREIIENNIHHKDIAFFIDNYWCEYAKELGVSHEEHCGHNYEISNDLIECYIIGKTLPRAITAKQIRRTISELEGVIKSNMRKGKPKKNQKLHGAILVFIKSGFFRGKNEDFRIMYECFDYMGLIEEGVKEGWKGKTNRDPEVQYIKSAYKEASKYSGVAFDKITPF